MQKLLMLALAAMLVVPMVARAESAVDTTGLRSTAGAVFGEESVADDKGDLPMFIGNYIIQPILGLVGLVFFLMMLYAGVLWMTAGGNSDQVKKAKDIFVNGVIGVVIVAAAFALTEAIFNAITTGSVST